MRGVHPWEAGQQTHHLLTSPPAVIGEIGLDFVFEKHPQRRSIQEQTFRDQLQVARELRLPVILHTAGAVARVLHILKADKPPPSVVFHSFIGHPQLSEQVQKEGFSLSFGPRTLRSPKSLRAFATADSSLIVLETDSPQTLMPNAIGEPTDLLLLAKLLAPLRSIQPNALLRDCGRNSRRVLHLGG